MKKFLLITLAIGSLASCATYQKVKPKVLESLHAVCDGLPELESALESGEKVVDSAK